MYKIGVFAVILNNKKEVLLCHRKDHDLWNLPGGGLDKNESPWDGIIREVKEETGFKSKIKNLIGIYYKPQKNEVVFCFLCIIIGGSITLNNEADKVCFFSRSKLPNNLSQKHKERIDDALARSNKIIFKTQSDLDYIDFKKNKSLV